MGNKNMNNIYKKLHNACNTASSVKKASKVKGMHFNPLLHDNVLRVSMEALLGNGLYPTCSYVTDVTDKCVIALNLKTGLDLEDGYNATPFKEIPKAKANGTDPTYLDEEINVEGIKDEFKNTKTLTEFNTVNEKYKNDIQYLIKNNLRAYRQVSDIAGTHKIKLQNNNK